MIPIHLIIVSRNAGEFTQECLASVLSQDYERMLITWVDDASDDGSAASIAEEMIHTTRPAWKDSRGKAPFHRIIKNMSRMGGLFNAHREHIATPPGWVTFAMGGDDKLLRDDALSLIAKCYEDDPECWFQHGSSWFHRPDGSVGTFSLPALHDDFRTHPFHWLPCSWRSELTPKVDIEDLKLGGWWFQSAGDVALYTPILEMCGLERIRFLDETIYWYRAHSANEGKLNTRYQEFCGWEARMKPRYSRLASLEDMPTRTPHQLPTGICFPPQFQHGVAVRCKINGDQVMLGPA